MAAVQLRGLHQDHRHLSGYLARLLPQTPSPPRSNHDLGLRYKIPSGELQPATPISNTCYVLLYLVNIIHDDGFFLMAFLFCYCILDVIRW
jgi:hypothetical protein